MYVKSFWAKPNKRKNDMLRSISEPIDLFQIHLQRVVSLNPMISLTICIHPPAKYFFDILYWLLKAKEAYIYIKVDSPETWTCCYCLIDMFPIKMRLKYFHLLTDLYHKTYSKTDIKEDLDQVEFWNLKNELYYSTLFHAY